MEVEDAVYLQTDHQLLLVSLKGKLVHEFHLLDVKKIESKTSEVRLFYFFLAPRFLRLNIDVRLKLLMQELTLTVDKKDPLTLRTKHCDEIIAHIRVGFARDFPTASEVLASAQCDRFDRDAPPHLGVRDPTRRGPTDAPQQRHDLLPRV